MNPTAKKVAHFGLLVALALVLGLMDRAIPLSALLSGAVPGVKLGLANTVLVYAVFLLDWKSCFLLMLAKVVLSGLLFGSLSAILYSLSGGLLSLLVMLLIRRRFLSRGRYPGLRVIAVSLCGAVAHNVGQIVAAALVLQTPRLLITYLPVLAAIGAAVGCLTGLIASRVLRAVSRQDLK